MIHKYSIELERVKIRPLEGNDIESLRDLRNKKHNRVWFIDSNKVSSSDQKKWFESYKHKKNDFMFIVEEIINEGIIIGSVALYNINEEMLSGEFGRLIIDGDTAQSGLGYDATMGACIIGFEKLGLEKINLEVYKSNLRAIKIYKKIGFIELEDEKDTDIMHMELKKESFIIKRKER
ncbi:GNAT family protein [Clostridioides difficile]